MTAAVEFGAQLRSHPPERQWRIVRRLEALGFASVWSGDHVAFNVPLHESLGRRQSAPDGMNPKSAGGNHPRDRIGHDSTLLAC